MGGVEGEPSLDPRRPPGKGATEEDNEIRWRMHLVIVSTGGDLCVWDEGTLGSPSKRKRAPTSAPQKKKTTKWPFSRSLTQNKPCLKRFHDLTLFHGARPHGAVVLMHGALPLGAVVFSSVAHLLCMAPLGTAPCIRSMAP
jgi:hypothetical protein